MISHLFVFLYVYMLSSRFTWKSILLFIVTQVARVGNMVPKYTREAQEFLTSEKLELPECNNTSKVNFTSCFQKPNPQLYYIHKEAYDKFMRTYINYETTRNCNYIVAAKQQ